MHHSTHFHGNQMETKNGVVVMAQKYERGPSHIWGQMTPYQGQEEPRGI